MIRALLHGQKIFLMSQRVDMTDRDGLETVIDAFVLFLRKELYDMQAYCFSVVYWYEQVYPCHMPEDFA